MGRLVRMLTSAAAAALTLTMLLGGCGSDKSAAPDTTPPSVVADLAAQTVGCDSVTLAWTAPGDDGTQGQASAYDLRYSIQTITESNWASATKCQNEPNPQSAGHTDDVTIPNLMPESTYYFALKARDGDGNESGLSNICAVGVGMPAILWVRDGLGTDEDWTSSTTSLSANWSGVLCAGGYQYAIGTICTGTDLVDWASAGTDVQVTRSGLGLAEGHVYYVSIRTILNTGYGDAICSDGVTVDASPPTSSVDVLPPASGSSAIVVSWSGGDDISGVRHYDVQTKNGGGPWQDWLMSTTLTSAGFPCTEDHTYYFRCCAWDSAGNVEPYPEVPDAATVATCTYSYQLKWPLEGKNPSDPGYPQGIAVDKHGFVYVTEIDGSRVQRFDPNGDYVNGWGELGSGDGAFYVPCDLTVDDSDYVYVVDEMNKRVQKFTVSGEFVGKWGTPGTGDGEFMNPRGIAADGLGYVYVTDMDNNVVQKFTRAGTFVARWGGAGAGDGEMNGPTDVAVGPAGTIYVAEFNGQRIQEFTAEGVFITKWGTLGQGDGQFNGPQFITVDASGHVLVSDYNNHRIQRFASDGAFLNKWGGWGSADGQFNIPVGIATNATGYVFVSEYGNNRVQKFVATCP
jgi:streptogramin lyase